MSEPCGQPFCCGKPNGVCEREGAAPSGQSDAAAERSAHVTRGQADAPGMSDAIVETAPGSARLRVAIERDEARAEVERLRAVVDRFGFCLNMRRSDIEDAKMGTGIWDTRLLAGG